MTYLNGKAIIVEGKKVALLSQSRFGIVTVTPLPSCSLGMHFYVLTWLKDLGYDVR